MDITLLKNFLLVTGIGAPALSNGANRRPYFQANEHWRQLFQYYNENKHEYEKPLHLSCQPCYTKVYDFCKRILLNQCLKDLAIDSKGLETMAKGVEETGEGFTELAHAAEEIEKCAKNA